MKKHYTAVKLYTQRQNGLKYILELSTNSGYADEYYEFNGRTQAREARERAVWLHKNQFCMQEFEEFENMGKAELTFVRGGLKTIKQMKNFYKWCMR